MNRTETHSDRERPAPEHEAGERRAIDAYRVHVGVVFAALALAALGLASEGAGAAAAVALGCALLVVGIFSVAARLIR